MGSLGEDAPQVAAVVDEQPPEMRSFSKTLREVPFIEKDSHQNARSIRPLGLIIRTISQDHN